MSRSPSQRNALRLGRKQYSPPRVTTKRGNAARTLRIGLRGIGNIPLPSAAPADRILLRSAAKESAIVHPLGLNELELTAEIRADESEHQPSLGTVILQNAVGQAAARMPYLAESSDEFARTPATSASRGFIRRICEPERRLISERIVGFEQKGVILRRVGADCGIVVNGTQRERSPAAPAAHHLRRQELLVVGIRCVRLEILPKCGNPLVQLSKHDVTAVSAEDLRLRDGGTPPNSSGYPRTNSPGFNGTSCGFVPGIPLPSIAGWLMPSLKPNGSVSVGKSVAILPPDRA